MLMIDYYYYLHGSLIAVEKVLNIRVQMDEKKCDSEINHAKTIYTKYLV